MKGTVERLHDDRTLICKNLFKPGTDMNMFIGMNVRLGSDGLVGRIDSTFGKTKFKCVFDEVQGGAEGLAASAKNQRLFLKYKRFVFDPDKKMVQT